jgi:hypothetical protein
LSDQPDLTETLALAAADAVRARKGAIEAGGAGAWRAITIKIEPANKGAVMNVETYVSWRQTVRRA